MSAPRQSQQLDLRVALWKTRARGRQKWLELLLSLPSETSTALARRRHWVADTLERVRRARAAIARRAARLDAYGEHLSVLEMMLMAAAEEKPKKTPAADKAEPSKT